MLYTSLRYTILYWEGAREDFFNTQRCKITEKRMLQKHKAEGSSAVVQLSERLFHFMLFSVAMKF